MLSCQIKKELRDFKLDIAFDLADETTVIIGHSGCGKSTTLRLLSGLLEADQGHIQLHDNTFLDTQKRINIPPEKRGMGFMFQNYALFPHMTVEENISYGFSANMAKKEQQHRLDETVEMLEIGSMLHRMPADLSGGEQQRVALARALVLKPRALLLDEPLSALDVTTRGKVRRELKKILSDLGIPSIVVTHDYEDAIHLGDRILVMEDGHIVQEGTSDELLLKPRTSFVADFSGSNYFHVQHHQQVPDGHVTSLQITNDIDLLTSETEKVQGNVAAVIYPWDILVEKSKPSHETCNSLHCRVLNLFSYGNRVRIELEGGLFLSAELPPEKVSSLKRGDHVYALFAYDKVHVIGDV